MSKLEYVRKKEYCLMDLQNCGLGGEMRGIVITNKVAMSCCVCIVFAGNLTHEKVKGERPCKTPYKHFLLSVSELCEDLKTINGKIKVQSAK